MNRLIFTTVKCGVLFAVRTELLNIILTGFGFTASSLTTGDARPRAVLKTVILFLAEQGGAA
jgi:hypothetical protein